MKKSQIKLFNILLVLTISFSSTTVFGQVQDIEEWKRKMLEDDETEVVDTFTNEERTRRQESYKKSISTNKEKGYTVDEIIKMQKKKYPNPESNPYRNPFHDAVKPYDISGSLDVRDKNYSNYVNQNFYNKVERVFIRLPLVTFILLFGSIFILIYLAIQLKFYNGK